MRGRPQQRAGGYSPRTFQGSIQPIPGDIIQTTRSTHSRRMAQLRIWLTPRVSEGDRRGHGDGEERKVRGKQTMSFTAFGKDPITATIDDPMT